MAKLVGRPCTICGLAIENAKEGVVCPRCEKPVHLECREAGVSRTGYCPQCGSDTSVTNADLRAASFDFMAHFFSFEGRSPRQIYILHTILDGAALGAVTVLMEFLTPFLGRAAEVITGVVSFLVWAGGIWSELAVTVRRLHDLDRPGSQCGFLLIPLYNIYFTLELMIRPGTAGKNQYGPDPLRRRAFVLSPPVDQDVELEEVFPNDPDLLLARASQAEKRRDWQQAFDLYKRSARLLSGQPGEQRAIDGLIQLQRRIDQEGDFDESA